MALAGKRDRVVIATKVGPRDDPRESLEESLRRLNTDYVDLLQLHEVGESFERSLEELARLKEEGKALEIGLCNATHGQLSKGLEGAPLSAYQAAYNLFDREVEQRELPLCAAKGLQFLAYRPLASGMLTNKFAAGGTAPFAPDDHRRGIWWFKGEELRRRGLVLDRMKQIADEAERSVSGLALAWLLNRPGVNVVLAGARTPGQLEENLLAMHKPLTRAEAEAVDLIVSEVFRPARATAEAVRQAAGWGGREKFIVDRLDGVTPYDEIAAAWSDANGSHLMGAQVRQFVDQLAAEDLVSFGG